MVFFVVGRILFFSLFETGSFYAIFCTSLPINFNNEKNYLHLEIRGVFRTPKTPLATGLLQTSLKAIGNVTVR